MYKTKVFFTAAYSGKKDYQKYYDLIVKILLNSKVELVATELGNYKSLLTKNDLKKCRTTEEEHYLAIKNGIRWADLVVFELSKESFQVGHEATVALNLNKPVLGLSLLENWQNKIIHRYFYGVKYTQYTLREHISAFLEKHSNENLSERFNFFLSKRQLSKLEKLCELEGINKSEYLRNLLDRSS